MRLPELHLSRPGVSFPGTPVDNRELLRRVRAHYRGSELGWQKLESAILRMLRQCGSQERYLAPPDDARVADLALEACHDCLAVNQAPLDEVDLVICGGIARQYFEPATAVEVAAKLGIQRCHAFDVTSACVGHLEALQVAAAYLTLYPHYRSAMVCTAELTGHFVDYDIQSLDDLRLRAAGLTLGNAAACFLLRKKAWPRGSMRLLGIQTHTLPEHWQLCQAPVTGSFTSSSAELLRLGRLIPPLLGAWLDRVGWHAKQVDHFVLHQPAEPAVRQIIQSAGGDPARGIYTHREYGNTASASVGVTYAKLCQERSLKAMDKIVLGSAAAGFSVVMAAGEWIPEQAAGAA